jgi:hypothetical protein
MPARPPSRSQLRAQDLSGLPKADAETLVREIQTRAEESNVFARELLAELGSRLADLESGTSGGTNTPEAIYDSTSSQTLTNGAFTRIQYNQQRTDTDTIVITGASWRAVIPTTGTYIIAASTTVRFQVSTAYDVALSVFINGAEVAGSSRLDRHSGATANLNNGDVEVSGCNAFRLTAGDEVDIRVYHSSGGDKSTEVAEGGNRFSIRRVR